MTIHTGRGSLQQQHMYDCFFCNVMQLNQSHKHFQDNNTCFTLTHRTYTSLPSSYCVSGIQQSFPLLCTSMVQWHVFSRSTFLHQVTANTFIKWRWRTHVKHMWKLLVLLHTKLLSAVDPYPNKIHMNDWTTVHTGQWYLGRMSSDESGPCSQLPSWRADLLFMASREDFGRVGVGWLVGR